MCSASLGALSAEVVLRVLDHLDDARDVVQIRQVSRRLHSLAGDTLLWRRLFVDEFLRHKGDVVETDERPAQSSHSRSIRTLPRVAEQHGKRQHRSADTDDDHKIDWLALYKVSRNWQTGHFASHRLKSAQYSVRGASGSVEGRTDTQTNTASLHQSKSNYQPDTLVASHGSLIFTTRRLAGATDDADGLFVFPAAKDTQRSQLSDSRSRQEPLARFDLMLSSFGSSSSAPSIACLAVDSNYSSSSFVRLVIVRSDSTSIFLRYDMEQTTFFEDKRVCLYDAAPSPALTAYHWPYMATCSDDFHIRTYRIRDADSSLQLVDERRSYSCQWPACLRLEGLESAGSAPSSRISVRLSVAFTLPVYPQGWTVGLQEIVAHGDDILHSRSAIARQAYISTRIDSPSKVAAAAYRSQKGEARSSTLPSAEDEISRLTSLSYENPFIVVGSRDNDVSCFRVEGAVQDASWQAGSLAVRHVRTLHGHTGSVYSVSLNEGRCVTGGGDGSVRVWRLGDEEMSIARATGLLTTLDGRMRHGRGSVVTLQPNYVEEGGSSVTRKRKRDCEGSVDSSGHLPESTRVQTHRMPHSLAEILRQARTNAPEGASGSASRASNSVIRWVASTFDRIISVSSAASSNRGGHYRATSGSSDATPGAVQSTCRHDAREEEQVQVWSFSS